MHTFLSFKRLSPIGAAVLILIMVVMLYPMLPPDPQPAHAATTRYAANNSELQAALDAAQARDTILVKNGTYTGTFTIRNNAGTASAPITLKAENLQQAKFTGDGTYSGSDPYGHNVGIDVQRPYWIIDGLDLSQYEVAVSLEASNIEVRNNLIRDFFYYGILLANQSSSFDNIHENVIAHSPSPFTNGVGFNAGIFIRAYNKIILFEAILFTA